MWLVVSIQNDYTKTTFDSATICGTYIEFIDTVKTKYPSTKIVLLNSPMATYALGPTLDRYLKVIAKKYSGGVYALTWALQYKGGCHGGCGYHPDNAEQAVLGKELSAFLKTI